MWGGWFLRGIHHFTAQAMNVLLVLHLFWVRFAGLLFMLFFGVGGLPTVDRLPMALLQSDQLLPFLVIGTGFGFVSALDARSGKELWRHDPKVDSTGDINVTAGGLDIGLVAEEQAPAHAALPGAALLPAIQKALAPDEALLSFQIGCDEGPWGDFGGGSWLVVVTRGRVAVHRLRRDRGIELLERRDVRALVRAKIEELPDDYRTVTGESLDTVLAGLAHAASALMSQHAGRGETTAAALTAPSSPPLPAGASRCRSLASRPTMPAPSGTGSSFPKCRIFR